MKKVLIIVLILFLIIGIFGCKVTNEFSANHKFKINRKSKIGNLVICVNSVRLENTDVINPKPGYIYYIVDITIGNKGKRTVEICPFVMFKLYDSQGFEHRVTFIPKTKGDLSGPLKPRSKMRGEIAFEIPADSSGLYLVFEPIITANGKATICLN